MDLVLSSGSVRSAGRGLWVSVCGSMGVSASGVVRILDVVSALGVVRIWLLAFWATAMVLLES